MVIVSNSKSGDAQAPTNFLTAAGVSGSATEAAIIEQIYGVQGISAAQAMHLANLQGLKLYTITSSNLATVLPLLQVSTLVETDIRNAVNAGKEVTIPEQDLVVSDWNGIGYIVSDPTTGAGAYIISGGVGGANNVSAQGLDDVQQGQNELDEVLGCLARNNFFLIVLTYLVVVILLFPASISLAAFLVNYIASVLTLGFIAFQCGRTAGILRRHRTIILT